MTQRKAIQTAGAPTPVGAYAQAIECGGMIFLSGQIPLHPETGEMVSGSIEAQTERVMANLAAVLAAASLGFANVVKATIFVTDLADFKAVDAIFGRYFAECGPPARATFQVAALPRSADVEIEMIAMR